MSRVYQQTDFTPGGGAGGTARTGWPVWLAAVALVGLGLLAYANGFTGRFAGLDAKESIRDNPYIRRLWPLTDAMSLPLLADTMAADAGAKGGTVVRRPVLSLTFALNYNLIGPEPFGFHLGNLAIHVAAALLLFGMVRRTLEGPRLGARFGPHAAPIALATAALWLVHPLQTEAVTYIVQRAESLMGMLVLATLYAGVRAWSSPHPGRWYALAVACAAMSMGTKETAAVAPVLVVAYDYLLRPEPFGQVVRRRWPLYAGLAAAWTVLAALVLATLADVGGDVSAGESLRYLLAQPGVILHYLRLAVWPHPLHLYVNTDAFTVRPGTMSPAALLRAIVFPSLAVGALGLATVWAVARRHPAGFLGVWLFVILAPTSSFVATSDVIQEHRMYLPLAAVVLAIVLAAQRLLAQLGDGSRRYVASMLSVGVIAVLILVTWNRNRDYHSEFAMVYPPDLGEAYMILANHHLARGTLAAAKAPTEQALARPGLDPAEAAYAHFLLGFAYEREGDYARAARHFRAAAEGRSDFAYAHTELGAVLMRQGRVGEAREQFERALVLRPDSAQAHVELAVALLHQDDHEAAERHLREAIAREPGHADAHYELGQILAERGDWAGARRHFERALAIDPDFSDAAEALEDLTERKDDDAH